MKYLNDVLLNFDEIAYEFYEWEKEDDLVRIKRVPVVCISEKDLFIFLQNKIQIDKEELSVCSKKEHIIIFTSKKDHIAIEFDLEGKELFRSRLTIEDDLNVCEIAYSLKEKKLRYQTLQKICHQREMRIASKEKQLIQIELKVIEASHQIEKLSYLFYEWFDEIESHFDQMLNKCYLELQKPYSLQMHKIAHLIKLSYKEPL